MWNAFKAVLWSFLGIRKHAEYEADQRRLKPLQVIIAGLIVAMLFVLLLMLVVRAVVAK